MSSVSEFETLTCACGGTEFLQMYRLTWKDGGGTVQNPIGWRCASCDGKVDSVKLITDLKLKMKRKELKQLEEEVNESTTQKILAKKV